MAVICEQQDTYERSDAAGSGEPGTEDKTKDDSSQGPGSGDPEKKDESMDEKSKGPRPGEVQSRGPGDSKLAGIDCNDAAIKLAKELPPELAGQADSIIKALQRAATNELLKGCSTPGKAEGSIGADGSQTPKPTEISGAPAAAKPQQAEGSEADGVQTPKPTEILKAPAAEQAEGSKADGAQTPKPTEISKAPADTKVEAPSDHDGEPYEEGESDGGGDKDGGNKNKAKKVKSEDEKAHHAAWMRMHRQIRSGGLEAAIVLCNSALATSVCDCYSTHESVF